MSIADQLRPCLEEMTRSERKVASRFLGNPDDFAFMTLERAAAETGVSTTTVLRFCRRLNFLGYKDFQEALRQDMKRQPNLPEKYRRTVAQKYRCAVGKNSSHGYTVSAGNLSGDPGGLVDKDTGIYTQSK